MIPRRMVLERVRPFGRAGALARGITAAADRLAPGYRPDDPYVCGRGHLTHRVWGHQAAAIEARRWPACRRCGAPMRRDRTGEVLRAVLAEHTGRVVPSAEALERIRTRIEHTNGATPSPDGAAHNDDDF